MAKEKDSSEAKSLFPDEAKAFMAAHEEGSYELLDVRQPVEYETAHLPGARLIPLPFLADSLAALDPAKPLLVYCAVGGRSRMAAQLLKHNGFADVYQLQGGIEAWEERTATGPREFHLQFIRGDETPDELIDLAYRMEEGLKKFHQSMQAKTSDPELSDLLVRLVKAEEIHETTLVRLLESLHPDGQTARAFLETRSADLLEGGLEFEAFMRDNEPFLRTVSGYADVAMMIETQALDLYLRMAAESAHEETRRILLRIADEEKAHLAALGNFIEQKGWGA